MRDRSNYNSYQQSYQNLRYQVRKQLAVAQLGGVCSCGSIDQLEFDHIDPSTKLTPIGKMWTASEDKLQSELAKCQLLCKPCHIEKTRQENKVS